MSIKRLSSLLDSNPKQSNSNLKNSLDSDGITSDPLVSTPLDAKELKKFTLYSENVKKSKHSNFKRDKVDKFTNFLSSKNLTTFQDNINLFWPELQNLNLHELEESNYSLLDGHQQRRLERIFNLYLDKPFSLSDIRKVKLRTKILNKSTPFRIFVILKSDEYSVFLLDPHHLVITDVKTREDKVFELNKGNGICMSKYLD